MNDASFSESQLLQLVRSAVCKVNEREKKHYRFVHRTPDGHYENRVESWNSQHPDARAVGEISGDSDFGIERHVVVSIHQQSSVATFELTESFESPWMFPPDAPAQYNFHCDLLDKVRFAFIPYQADGTSRLLVDGLTAHGELDNARMSLGRALHNLALARSFVTSRLDGGGRDSWSESVELMSTLDAQLSQIQTPDSGLTILVGQRQVRQKHP